jgi:tRNA (guanine37-N1)-methyltransferase
VTELRLSFDVVTLFPEAVTAACRIGVIGRALETGTLVLRAHQLREYTGGSPHPIDDHPYGGGPGMVIRPEPVFAAVEDVSRRFSPSRRILLSPQGRRFEQHHAIELAQSRSLLLFCARYEGVDERVVGLFDEELSIGDFILTGGELAALVVIDAVGRLVPEVLGSPESTVSESFHQGLLEYPQYTRPESFRGMQVPPVLLSGNHQAIERWRRDQAMERTRNRRPDLRRTPPDGTGNRG